MSLFLLIGWDIEELKVFSANGHPKLMLKIGSVDKSKAGGTSFYHYDADGYCKRHLGNSCSIPVVEHSLRPVRDLFMHQEYRDAAIVLLGRHE